MSRLEYFYFSANWRLEFCDNYSQYFRLTISRGIKTLLGAKTSIMLQFDYMTTISAVLLSNWVVQEKEEYVLALNILLKRFLMYKNKSYFIFVQSPSDNQKSCMCLFLRITITSWICNIFVKISKESEKRRKNRLSRLIFYYCPIQ